MTPRTRSALRIAGATVTALALLVPATGAEAAPHKKFKKSAAAVTKARGWGIVKAPAAPVTESKPSASTDPLSKRSVRLTDAQARALLSANGITVYSSGNCTNRQASNCTSLDTILTAVVADVISLKKRSGCSVILTGGTETGHASGPSSHWNGYKADVNMSTCLSTWVAKNGKAAGAGKWTVGTALYWHEGNHFDITSKV